MISMLTAALSVVIIVLGPDGAQPAGPAASSPNAPSPSSAGANERQVPEAGLGLGVGVDGGGLANVSLSGWKLTIPQASDKGHAASVSPTDNRARPWLTKTADRGLTMWAPVDGSTTPNSTHARTELVSLTNFTAGNSGRHTLRARLAVQQVPTTRPDIIVGQIHGAGPSLSSSSFVMLHYDSGQIRVVVKRGTSGPASDKYPLISGVPLNSPFDYAISDNGDGTLSFTATHGPDTRTATASIPEPFRGATVRFQAGDYQQADSTGGGQTNAGGGDGGRVTFDALHESHTD